MKVIIADLPIQQKKIGERNHAAHRFGGAPAAGFEAGVESFMLAGRQQCLGEISLCRRLAAGNGDAAAGCCVEYAIGEYLGEYFINGFILSGRIQGVEMTALDATAAADTFRAVILVYAAGHDLVCAMHAKCGAGTAPAAAIGAIENLSAGLMRFGIMAPHASQGTALEKDGGAYARAIIHAEVLNV